MSVMAPYRSGRPVGTSGSRQLLRAEWTKFRTVRGWVIGILVGLLLMVGLGVLTTKSSACGVPPTQTNPSGACPAPPTGPGGEWVTDAFYFVRQPLGTSGSITVRVTSLTGRYGGGAGPANSQGPVAGGRTGVQPWSKAGIIVKDGTRQGSPYAAMMVTGGHGVRMQGNFTQDLAGLPGAVSAASPRWLRLARSGDTVTGYDSAEGIHWDKVGTVTLAGLPSTVQVGLFATSPAYQNLSQFFGGTTGQIGPSLATGVFDHVSLRGPRPGSWSGVNVGNQGAFGPQTGQVETFRQGGGRFTVTGSGDIAPQVPGEGAAGPTRPSRITSWARSPR